jgi:hypothetical protein
MANPYDMTKPFNNRAQAIKDIEGPGALDYADRVDTKKIENSDKKTKLIPKNQRIQTGNAKIDSYLNSTFNKRVTSITDKLGNLLFNPKRKINYVIKGADLLTEGKVSKNVEEAVSQIREVGQDAFGQLSKYRQQLTKKLKEMGGGFFTREMDKSKLTTAQKEIADEIDEVSNLQNEINAAYKLPTTELTRAINKEKKPLVKELKKDVSKIDLENISMVDLFPGTKSSMKNPLYGLGKGVPKSIDTPEQTIFNYAKRPLEYKYGKAKLNEMLRAKDPKVMQPISEALGKYKNEMKELLDFKQELLKTYYDDLVKVADKFPMEKGKGFLDFSHKFPTSITQRLNPSSKLLQKGADPSMMYISPAFVNRRVQVFFDDVAEQLMGSPPTKSTRPFRNYVAASMFDDGKRIVDPFTVGGNKGQFLQMLKNKQNPRALYGLSDSVIKAKQKNADMAAKTLDNIRTGLKRVQAESMYDLPPEMGGFIQAGKPGGITNKQQMKELLQFLLDPATDTSTVIAPYKDGGSVFTNPFLKKIDEVFNPITNEPPAGVTDQPPEGGFLEPIAEGIAEQIGTAEGLLDITAPFTLTKLDDTIDYELDKIRAKEILDDDIKQYLMSVDQVKDVDQGLKADMLNVTTGMDREGTYMSSFLNPILQSMMQEGKMITSQDVENAYDNLKNSQDYKDLTYRATSPEFAEQRALIQSKLHANQLKKLPLDIANILVETYQFSPLYFGARAIEQLPEKIVGESLLEREHRAMIEQGLMKPGSKPIDMYLPGGVKYDPENTIPFEEIINQFELEREYKIRGELTGKDFAASAGQLALSITPAFLGSGVYGRMMEVAKNKDLSKLGKFIRIAPQALGFPSLKELKSFGNALFISTPSSMYKTGKEPAFLANIIRMINDATDNTKEKTDEYYANIRSELENPQYAEQREILKNKILEIYESPDISQNVVNPEDFDKLLKEADSFEEMPEFVYDMAQEEAYKILDSEKFRLLGKEPKEIKTMQDDTLFEEVTGIDLAPGERETPPSNIRNMAMGGDPGQFTDPLRTPDDSGIDVRGIQEDTPYMSIDELDLFEEANLKPTTENNLPPQVEMASLNIFGKAPGWAVYLDKKSDIIKGGNQTKNLIRIGDEVAEATATAGEDIGRFYSNVEAKLLDPSVPDVFETPADLYNFFQSRNISKLEVEDYQLPQLFSSLFQTGQPVTKQVLLDRIKQAPIRKLKTKTFGFRSDIEERQAGVLEPELTSSKYGGGHYESGSLPNTYREHVVYLDPQDIPGDPGTYKYSTHDFFRGDQAYVVGWSRLTDRPGIVPGTAKQLSGDATKLPELENKRDRLTAITNKSAQDIVDQSGGRVSMEQAQKNIDNAQKQLVKIQDDIDNLGSPLDVAVVDDQVVNVTFADEIQSDIFQTYRKNVEQVKKEYLRLLEKGSNLTDVRIIGREKQGDVSSELIKFYAKHKDILRPVFRTEADFAGHIQKLQNSNKIFKEFADIRPGTLTPEDMIPVRAAQKERDDVLKFFDEAVVNPETMKSLFPNIPFKDRKLWGDVIVKNDLHAAAKRLFVENDPNAPTWYAITPAELVTKRYGQAGTTATPLADRAGKKGVGTYEFYGGPDVSDVSGKHYTSVLEQSLKRAANINNSEFKIIKVAIGEPRSKKKVIQVISMDGQNILKEIRVKSGGLEDAMSEATDFINSSDNAQNLYTKTTTIPSGFKTVDAYAIKLTPEMVLPSKTHLATGGLVQYNPLPNIEELIGAA